VGNGILKLFHSRLNWLTTKWSCAECCMLGAVDAEYIYKSTEKVGG
jgi:hypothetical protein